MTERSSSESLGMDQERSTARTEAPASGRHCAEMYERLASERPLDAHVSIHIMGWHVAHDGLNYRWTDDGGNWRKYITGDCWSPSTSISDAWEVVEEMKGDGRSWSQHFHTVMTIAENYNSREVSAAICRAALRAVGRDDA